MAKAILTLLDIRSWGIKDKEFKVESMTNTIAYEIDQKLSSRQVQNLCNIPNHWTIHIKKEKNNKK